MRMPQLFKDLIRGVTIVFVERRLPGRVYSLYFRLLNRMGIRFATIRLKNGFVVRAYTHCITILHEIWDKRDYDIPGFSWDKSMTAIDIGANQGFFSLYAASKGATVYAFEPCQENFAVFRWNVENNGLGEQVRMFNSAVTGKKGQVALFVGLDRSGEILSGSVSTCNPNRGGIGVKATQVESVTLDSIMDDLRIGKCDFLKMDCEGAEYEILRNTSRRTFRKIGRISMECHGNRMSEAETMLKEAGFDIVCARPGITGVLKAVNTQSDGAEFLHLSRV
ncbi:MAG: hypothetical protein A3H28_07165 [Acidobacteria bacterium RIFCSPLOWO2_02_FULL_61_28]|nr:MAG: hypothetical protein A3H28_07165 [Acidobacteria bacterium RIFCSPLOWO2_02_FULL_61_28]